MRLHIFIMQAATFIQYINKIKDSRIVLLRQKEVVQWLLCDLSFLQELDNNRQAEEAKIKGRTKKQETDSLKILEDQWGQEMVRLRRPDLKLDKQWTNKFGEHIAEEIYWLLGKNVTKPKKKENYQPDTEIDDAIIEAKTQTYYTTGTAGEKIIGCPFKYAEIPTLYSKPLKILCMGGAERICREQYGNLPGQKCSPQKQRFLDFFRENQIEYVAASELLLQLLQ